MVDKLRKTFPIKITFGDGEQPSSQKLTAFSNQTRNGMAVIERAVGDLWNQGGDEHLEDHPLQIPNLARVIGEQKYLNPVMYPLDQKVQYTDYLNDAFARNEGYLTFVPDTLTSLTTVNNVFITRVTNETDVDASGEYWVDGSTGRFRCYDAILGNTLIQYDVDTSDWIAGDFEVVPCVIPDPRQTEFTHCRISTSSGKFYLHLPPRRPIILSGFEAPARYPYIDDLFNEASTGGAPYKMWQKMDVNAIADRHYRYPWPKEIRDIITGLTEAVDEIPAGFLYLWDDNENTIVEDVVFKKGPNDWTIEISSASEDFSLYVTSNESEASYSSSKYRLIIAGAPLARALWVARNATLTSKHNNQGDLLPTIKHGSLHSQNPPSDDAFAHGGTYPTYLPAWFGSYWKDDDHTSLLSRAGAQTNTALKRDKWNNAMLGPLLMANADTSGADNYISASLPNGSFQIFFGDVASSLYIQGVNSQSLEIQGSSGSHLQLNALSVATNQASIKFNDNDVSKWQIGKQVDNNFFIWDNANGKDMLRIRFSPSDIQLVPVSGNVGVGSITPVNKFDVAGAVAIGTAYAGVSAAPANSLIVESSIGIGTTAPARPLEISSSSFVQKLRLTHTAAGGESLSLGNGTSASTFLFTNTGGLWIGGVSDVNAAPGSGDADLAIDSSGNVGIGTVSPSANLTILNATSPALHLRRDASNEWFFRATAVGSDRLGIRAGTDSDAAERVSILTGGNVGIGTTNPLDKLHVVGNLRADGDSVGLAITHPTGPFTRTVLRANDSNTTGMQLIMDSGGSMIVGAGESGGTISSNVTAANEVLYLGADQAGNAIAIRLMTGFQTSGWASRVEALNIYGDGRIGIMADPASGHQVDIAGQQGSSGNTQLRVLYPGGGSLANTEFGALAHRDSVWSAVYGKQGSASYAGYFDGTLHLSSQTSDPGSPLRGDMYVRTIDGKMSVYNGNSWDRVVQQQFLNSAISNTVSNTTAQTDFNSNTQYVIPANTLRQGSYIRYRFAGVCNRISGTMDMRVYLVGGSTNVIYEANCTTWGDHWQIDGYLRCANSTGGVGGWGNGGMGIFGTFAQSSDGSGTDNLFSAALTLKCSVQFSAASSNNSATCTLLEVDIT